jgi:hypothetical protein
MEQETKMTVKRNPLLNDRENEFVAIQGGLLRVTMPYATPEQREIVDGIARKLKLNKRFRGPRRSRAVFRYNECLKRDAVAVVLYRYTRGRDLRSIAA